MCSLEGAMTKNQDLVARPHHIDKPKNTGYIRALGITAMREGLGKSQLVDMLLKFLDGPRANQLFNAIVNLQSHIARHKPVILLVEQNR
jgi:hypothetical protein